MTPYGKPIEASKPSHAQTGERLKMAQERVAEPVEAICGVQEGTFAQNFPRALFRGRPARLSTLVLTPSRLYLFEPKFAGLRKPDKLGEELRCVPYSDIARIELLGKMLGTTFRLTFDDGSRLSLKLLSRQRGREVLERLAELANPGASTPESYEG
jgi:hypothetical protein